MEKELKSRRDIPVELTWDLSLIYATEEEMNRDVERAKSLCPSSFHLSMTLTFFQDHILLALSWSLFKWLRLM